MDTSDFNPRYLLARVALVARPTRPDAARLDSQVAAFNAETGTWNPLPLTPPLVSGDRWAVGTNVCAVAQPGCGMLHGYSALTDRWDSIPAGVTPDSTLTVEGNAAVLLLPSQAFGFAADSGTWTPAPTGIGPEARILSSQNLVVVVSGEGRTVHAFSGITGTWAPLPAPQPSARAPDARGGPLLSTTPGVVRVGANVALAGLYGSGPVYAYSAIRSLDTWVALPWSGPGVYPSLSSEDTVQAFSHTGLVIQPGRRSLHGFSANTNEWSTQDEWAAENEPEGRVSFGGGGNFAVVQWGTTLSVYSAQEGSTAGWKTTDAMTGDQFAVGVNAVARYDSAARPARSSARTPGGAHV